MREQEWRMFNDALLELYYLPDLKTFGQKCLELIKIFIPYDYGNFIVIDENRNIDVEQSIFLGVQGKMLDNFIELYFKEDYLADMWIFSKSMVYRDSDLLEETKRKNSSFYQNYSKPLGKDYGCGIIVMQDKNPVVSFNISRKKGCPDVTKEEMEILQILLDHFEKNVLHFMEEKQYNPSITHIEENSRLSNREKEIVYLICQGKSNVEIAELLHITPATVKKHLSNIFAKTGLKRRTQLFSLIQLK